ncbi:MAG: hypothetical protein U0800_04160 [Isosphaeraceae bacterium]
MGAAHGDAIQDVPDRGRRGDQPVLADAFAAVETDSEGIQLRLGFAGHGGQSPREIRLCGLEARSVLRWLRSNAEFLDSGTPTGRPHRVPARGELPACPPHLRAARAPELAIEA